MDFKGWGVIVMESGRRYSPLTFAAGEMFDSLKRRMQDRGYGMNYVAGTNGISDEDIDRLSADVFSVVERANSGEVGDILFELQKFGLGV